MAHPPILIQWFIIYYSAAQASVSWASNKLGDWLSDWVRDYSPWASSAMEVAKETKFGTNVA